MPIKSAAVYTLGCKVNQYDTDQLIDILTERGIAVKSFDEPAELYIINTCTVTHVSDRKSRHIIRRARRMNPDAQVAVCGCLAKLSPDSLRDTGADFIFDTRDTKSFLTILDALTLNKEVEYPISQSTAPSGEGTFPPPETPPANLNTAYPARRTRAHIKIQEGCDRFCAYCIVPYARGSIVSRPSADIISEAEALLSRGVKEIVLTGIHVASYGKDYINETGTAVTLPRLLEAVATLDGLSRLRLGSIEPYAANTDFIQTVSRLPKLCAHFHLSLQSGCDRTLQRMNRRYTTAQYREAAQRLREALPDTALTTDIIVGFPGESDADFEESLHFVASMGFLRVHVFEYSPRAGTPAAGFDGQIPAQVKTKRSQAMRTLASEMTDAFLSAQLAREAPVLFESVQDGVWEGHTANYMTVRINSSLVLSNQIREVRFTKAEAGILYGEISHTIHRR